MGKNCLGGNMKVFNKEKTQEITNYDLTKGFLVEDRILIGHQNKVDEKYHYETIREYENGGKDVVKVIDVEPKDEMDLYEDIYVYIPYTTKELASNRIYELKTLLNQTDYKAIKYAEGLISEDEYAPIKAQRQAWRDEINELEQVL